MFCIFILYILLYFIKKKYCLEHHFFLEMKKNSSSPLNNSSHRALSLRAVDFLSFLRVNGILHQDGCGRGRMLLLKRLLHRYWIHLFLQDRLTHGMFTTLYHSLREHKFFSY